MAMKGKGKQIAGKSPAGTSSGKRKKTVEAESSGRKKKRRSGVLQFFDDAAVDADLDDDEELDDEDSDLEEEELDLDFGNEQSNKHEKGAGKAIHLPFFLKEEELSGDELEELIRDRYGRGSEHVVYDEDKECDDRVLAEHSVKDATVWKVKCMFGKEQQIAFCFMQKYVDLKELGTTMGIISVFALEHIKGYVFIEADKNSDVIEACRGFCNIYSTRVGLVPSSEIPHLLSVRNKVCEVSEGTWVRMKSGNYKGDLGQVVAVDEERKRATIKMVPRIDLEAIAKKFGGGISLKKSAVPAPRLISTHELEHFRPHIEIRRDRITGEVYEVLDGLMLKDGYLYKKLAIVSLVYWGVQPSEHELLKFTDTNKDEDGDVDWLSSVYKGRKLMKSTHASRDKGAAKEGNGYDLHELVLFGRKDFGVIIASGKDGIQILKGGTEGQQVVTVKSQEIKTSCDDKMFTAADCHMKTVSINDLVKVVEGPMEDRQGIVRHMYRGTLFLYDENQVDHSGIFHVKSKLCENTKQLKGSGGKSGNKASSSFFQSSLGSCDQEDNSRTNNGRYQQHESKQAFSIGQTLRIRKGPLKGYLCRVVGVYRTNVTVKLDSLVKVITVEEQFLSVPNIKSDSSTAVPIGVLSEEGREQPLGQSSWDTGRDSWQALSISASPFGNKDQKEDQERGDPWGSNATKDQEQGDPWGSKLPLATEDQKQGNADPWGTSKLAPVAEDEPWGSKLAPVAEDDPWSSKLPLANKDQEQGDPWGSKLAPVAEDDPWSSKLPLANKDQEQGDPWRSKLSLATIDQKKGDADAWGSSKLAPVVEDQEQQTKSADPWGSKLSYPNKDEGGAADPWGSKVVASATIDEGQGDAWGGTGKSRAQEQSANDPWSSKLAVATREQGQGDAWDNKAAFGDSSNEAMGKWGKTSAEQNSPWNSKVSGEKAEFKPQAASREKDADGWDKLSVKSSSATGGWENVKQPNVDDGENWGGKSSNAERGATWGNSSNQAHLKADAWDIKGKGVVNNEVPWGKAADSKEKDSNEFGQWGKPVDGSSERKALNSTPAHGIQTGGWDAASECLTKSGVENGGNTSSWEKVKAPSSSQSDQWGQGTTNATESVGWGKAGFSSQRGEWNASKASGGDQVSSWNKVDNEEAGRNDQWNKPRNFEGGRGRGRGRNAWDGASGNQEGKWNKTMDCDGGRGSGRDTGWNGSDGPGGSQDQENSWSGQKDFQSGRGFGRGRGRGRYEGRGSRDEHQERSYDSGGDWGSGRGRSGGRKGDAWSSPNNIDDTGSFGRGRGRGRGRFDSSDWKNNQENFGDGGFSKGSASGWGNDESSSWDKSKGTTRNESTAGTIDQQGGWLGRNSSQDQSSDWNTPKAYGDKKPSIWNQVSSGNDGGGWDDKLKTPTSVGKQSSGWISSEGKSWDIPKASASGGQFSAWEHKTAANEDAGKEAGRAGGNEASGAGSNWDRGKPCNTTQFSDWNSTAKDPISAGTKGVAVAVGGDNWSKAKPSSGQGGESLGWKQNSTSGEVVKEEGNSGGNWSRPKTFSGGNQSSGWGNDEGKTWNKPNSFGADSTDGGYQGGDQSGGWGRGRNLGRGQAFEGRGDSFTNRGRGRGRSVGGGRWNGGRGANQEDSGSDGKPGLLPTPKTFGRGQPSSWNQDGFTSGGNWNKDSGKEQSGWSAGKTANEGPWETRKSESGSQPTGWTKQESRWNESPTVDGSGKSGGGNWDQPKPSGNNGGAGWNTGKTKDSGSQPTGTKQESTWNGSPTVDGSCRSGGGSWDQAKPSGNNGGAGWNTGKTNESGSQKTGWAKQESTWNGSPTVDGSCKSRGDGWDQPKPSGNNSGAGWNTGKTNEAGPSGDHGSGWDKAAGSGSNAKDGAENKGGW